MSTQNQPVEYESVTYNVSTGALIVSNSTGKLGFFSTVPIARQTLTCAISTTAWISTSGCYGPATSTEGLQISNAISSVGVVLRAYGIVL